MRTMNKVLAGVAAIGLAATMTACSSSSKSAKPVGQFKTLTGSTTTVVPDPGFMKALTSLKVTPGLVGTAKATSEGFAFPITGGNATIYKKGSVNPYVQGVVDHQGSGLSLTAGGTEVDLTNFVVHPGKNSELTGDVSANGKSVAKGAKLFDLDGSTLKPITLSGGVATLSGTTIYLSTTAAALLNKTYKITALKGGVKTGTKVGTAIIRATGK